MLHKLKSVLKLVLVLKSMPQRDHIDLTGVSVVEAIGFTAESPPIRRAIS